MISYCKPSVLNVEMKNHVLTQSVSGEIPLIPLDCEGQTANCDAREFGAFCSCDDAFVTFLVPGATCASVNNGNDCTLSATCAELSVDSVVDCSEGCVVTLKCSTGNNGCEFENYTASCPGFETCGAATDTDRC